MKDMTILEFENRMTHFDVAYEQACIEHDLNLRRIHNKMVLENAIMEEATELYLAEAEETSGKKKNIFVRMIEAIQKFVRNLISKITGKPLEETPKEDIILEQNPKSLIQYGKDLEKKIAECLSGHKDAALNVGLAVAGTAAAGKYILKKTTAGDVVRSIQEYMKTVNDNLEKYKEQIRTSEGLGHEASDKAKKYVQEYSSVMSRLGLVVSSILGVNKDPDYQAIRDKHAGDINGKTSEQLNKELTDLKSKRAKLHEQVGLTGTFKRELSRIQNGFRDPYQKSYDRAGRAEAIRKIQEYDKAIEKLEDQLAASGRKTAKYNLKHKSEY